SALEEIDDPSECDQRPDHSPEIELEGDEGTDGHRVREDAARPEEEDEDEHQTDEGVQCRIERRGQPDQRTVGFTYSRFIALNAPISCCSCVKARTTRTPERFSCTRAEISP